MGYKKFPIVSNANIANNTTIGGVQYVNISSKFSLPKDSFVVNTPTEIAPSNGSASKSVIVFGSGFVINDQVRVTITIKDSAQTLVKNFVHTVTDTASTAIATAFENLISGAVTAGLPGIYSVAQGPGGTITVMSSSVVSNNISSTVYTSGAGSVSETFTAVTQAEGLPSVLKEAGVPAADITLSGYDTVLLTYKQDAPIPFIDSEGKVVKDVKAFVPVGQGSVLIGKF